MKKLIILIIIAVGLTLAGCEKYENHNGEHRDSSGGNGTIQQDTTTN